jgi:GNAT superfamily N-acetyltransferase
MADIYKSPVNYINTGTSPQQGGVQSEVEDYLNSLPQEERDAAMKRLTAPPSNKEIAEEALSSGRMPTIDEFRAIREYNKEKEVPILESIGNGLSGVMNDLGNAVGSAWDDPVRTLKTAPANVIEGFAQGTRNLYGMLSQSSDPSSKLFRLKSVINHADSDEEQYRQYMDAWKFNKHTEDLISGKETVVMDKDVIDPHIAQAMSYVLDPTLFIPFGEVASAGVKAVGMGEKLMAISARSAAIKNMVLGGTLKWGVGAPLEFMGGAIRNTIDYGIEQGAKGFEVVSGIPAKEIQTTARLSGWGTAAGSVAGFEVNNALGTISRTYAGAAVARNAGEAISIIGDQMIKQRATGRGVLGYAGQAIRDSERAGIQLSSQTKALLRTIEAVDPLFVYTNDIVTGAAHGAAIGGTLGYLSGGEEGMYHGIGAGIGLGAVGAGAGKVFADITGNTKLAQMAIQRKLVIEALKELGNDNAKGFEAMAKMAEATGDRAFQGYIDGIIAGIDTVNPDAVFKAYGEVEYNMHLRSQGIDPATGVLLEKSRIFPELVDRKVKADVLGILRDAGNRFAGDAEGFKEAIANKPEFSKLKDIWNRLDDNAKDVILKQIKLNGDADFIKSLRGRQLNAHWSDLAYSEKAAEIINELHQKNANSVPDKIRDMLKQETRSDKKLTRRGQMLKEKLQADGYIDREGNIRSKRLVDVEGTQAEFEASAGWAKRRDANGKTEVVINLDKWARDSGDRLSLAHELYHSIMMDSVFKPDYIDRLTQKLVGKFDPQTGRVLEPALVKPDELMKFFSKYIENDPNNKRDPEAIKRKKEELQKSIEEFRNRGVANRVIDSTATPLEHLVEEFGAYYFSKWLRDQPIDFLFRGGEFSGVRGLLEMAKDGWLDYWKGKVAEKNPNFNFDAMDKGVSRAFDRDGNRVSSRSLDLFMRDIVRIEANRNSGNRFDINRLSNESREWFIKVNGLRGAEFGQIDKQGNLKKPKLRRYTSEEIRQGKEMFKVLESLPDAAHKDGMRRDGDGNWSGKPNTAQINALVGAGYIQRAWFDRMMNAYAIVEGNGSNVVEFGYLGYSAHIGDGDARVYGAAVPFKNRRAVLIGVDFKVKADGTVFSNFHTLDLKVIEARGNEIWKDPQTRELWNGNRTEMEADFYAYLSNASLPSNHPNRKPSARILDKGDGLGSQRRDALHQMLGFHKYSDLPYINRPIAEIPVGIRHSVTTFSNDGIVNLRVDNKQRYNFNFENAHLDLSRNFMPSEMREEKTPSGGKIIKHATGYQISKQAGTKFKVFDPEGKHLGDFDTVADAGRAAQKHFNESYDKSVEGKDPAVPPTEIPPSRQAFIEREFEKTSATYNNTFVGGKDNYVKNVKVLLDRFINGREDVGVGDGYIERAKKLRESIEKSGSIKLSELEELSKLGAGIMHDTSRLPYYNYDFFWQITGDLLTENLKKIGEKYDNMYPMEIKSALHGTLAQIFQDYPQITAKSLIGKIQKYGSLNKARLMQEATEIGLIDLLKSKPMATKIKKEIYRVYDRATESFTGEVRTKEIPVQYEPFVDIQEILDFAKSKEIRVTIEEDAREVNNMNTSKLTLGGDKDNYKQTAIRINPEYAHGIKGHYGEDTIVHFRTTERVDSEGNRVLFIEEVQANNPYNTENPQVQEFKKKKTELESAIILKEESIKRGLFVLDENGKYQTAKDMLVDNSEHRKNVLEAIARVTGSNDKGNWSPDKLIFQEIEEVIATTLTSYGRDEIIGRLDDVFMDMDTYNIWNQLKTDKAVLDWVDASAEINKKLNEYRKDMEGHYDTSKLEYANVEYPENLIAIIADRQAVVDRLQRAIEGNGKRFPMTDVKDWSLTALKGIVRQAIRDGLDKITLTHPDDSPTKSYMKITARRPLYGKIIPDLWNSWLKQYGIEMKQSNKLADAGVEKRRAMMLKVTDKIHDANKLILERFQQVGNREDFSVIQRLTELLVAPVQDAPEAVHREVKQLALHKINDQELSKLIFDVAQLRAKEREHYEAIETIRAEGLRGLENNKTSTVGSQISEEAIDRGMTFELNDRIKRDFLDGKIQTHSMPAEGGFDFKPNSNKASKLLEQYLYGLKTGKSHQEMMTPELDYVFKNIEQFTKASNDDIINAILKLGDKGSAIVERFKNQEITLKQATEAAKNIDEYTYTAKLKDIRDERKGIYNAFMRATGQMRKISDNDARRLNTHAERESRNTRYHQPTEEDIYAGGREYNQNSKQFKSGFVGLYAAQNPDRVKGISLQFMKRADGTHRIRLTDNSRKGESADIGHITANIEGDRATLSAHINEEYRGKKLAYVVYSEMAERLRAMGVTAVDGQIVNPDGIPIKVRERIIGDTRDLYSGRRINHVEGANRIRDKQEMVGSMGGVDVTNTLYKQGRYMPTESEQGGRTYTDEQMSSKFIGRYAAENAKVTKGLKPKFSIFGSGDQGNIELMKGQDSIGYINFSFSKATGDALIEYTNVARGQQGKGYGNLLYSELVERLRSMGMKEVQGMIIDERGRPQKIRERIIDRENARIGGDRTQIDYVEKDPDSGDTHTGVTSYLYNKAWYQPSELEVLNIQRTQDMPWFRNLIAGGSYVRYAGVEELNYLRGLHAISHGADTLTGVDVNTVGGRRIVEGKGGLGYALNPNNPAAWASIGKGFINEINGAVRRNIDEAIARGMSRAEAEQNAKTAIMPLVFTTYRKNLNSVQGSEGYYNIFEILRRGNIISDKDLRLAMTKAVEKVSLDPKTKEYEKNQTETLRKIVKNTKSSWDEMLAGIFATLGESDIQNFGTRASMADDFFGAVWSRLDLSKEKEDKIKSIFPEWKTVSTGRKITVEDMKTNVASVTTDTLSRNLKSGDIYAILKFNDFVTDTESNHRSYDTGVIQENGQKPEILILKKPIQYSDFYASSVTSKGEKPLSELGKSQQTNLLGMNARPYGTAKVKMAGQVDFRDVASKMMPSEYTEFKSEQSATGRILRNAKGYVIMMAGQKFRVYNPAKAIIGVYSSEDEAKRRILRDAPKQ